MSRHLARFAGPLALAILLAAPAVGASSTFPAQLQKKLGLARLPNPPLGCQLCHQDDVGGLRTATKPFGRSLLRAGTMGASVPSLLGGLASLEADGTDSDGDGSPDIAELEAGTDPNIALTPDGTPGPPLEEIPLPETGCGLARGNTPSVLGGLLLAVVAVLLRRRR